MMRLLLAMLSLLLVSGAVQAAPGTVAVRTVEYSPAHRLKADVYELEQEIRGSRPAILMIHGGGWAAGDRGEFRKMATWVAQQGFVAFLIDYRLTTSGARWPAQARDAEQAVWWMRENARTLGIDPHKLIAFGGSAGGHLAAWLATTERKNENGTSSRANMLISLWGPWDLSVPGHTLSTDANGMIRSLVGEQDPRIASPLFQINAQSAPALLVHGARDELVPPSQSARACNALRAVNVECELLLLDREAHGLQNKESVDLVLGHIANFISRQRK